MIDDLDLEAALDARTNACAMVALFSALVGLLLPAIVFGVIGIRQCGRRDEDGWGMAWSGVVLGVIEAAVLVLGLLLYTM